MNGNEREERGNSRYSDMEGKLFDDGFVGEPENPKTKTAFRLIGASNHADDARQGQDYYATDPKAIDELLKKYDSNTIRFFILTNHYRMPVEFSDEALSSAQAGVKRMLNAKRTKFNEDLDITKTDEYKAFVDAMDDDLNTSKALAVLFELTNKANKDDKDAFTILYKLASTLGFTFEKATLSEDELKNAVKHVSEKLGKDFSSMEELIAYRKEARDAKNWDIADKIRIALDEVNIVLKDSKEGTIWEVK